MSLIVEVYVGSHLNKENRKLVAEAVVHNVSDLASVSDYEGARIEYGYPLLGIEKTKELLSIKDHVRNQSVWALVRKMVAKLET
jgi:pyruvate formate-lyase activating enzyme-like uncharacterized protein